MNISEMLIYDEDLKLKPYYCTGNKLTIGVGRNLEDNGISRDEAIYLMNNDIERIKLELRSRSAVFIQLDENRQDAIINMAFQMGVSGCLKFIKMWAALADFDYVAAYHHALDSEWAKQTPNRAERVAQVLLTGTKEAYKNA